MSQILMLLSVHAHSLRWGFLRFGHLAKRRSDVPDAITIKKNQEPAAAASEVVTD
ncbi:MAG: hypothetical protein WAK31_00910 [Chthoniobacterales bacterium]